LNPYVLILYDILLDIVFTFTNLIGHEHLLCELSREGPSQLVSIVKNPRLTNITFIKIIHTTETFMRKANNFDFQHHCGGTG
jgi:hypothetical protein